MSMIPDVSRSTERMLPNDMLAEQSALGGMLLSQEACAEVFESVKGSDFYAPKHELIFNAILSLFGKSWSITTSFALRVQQVFTSKNIT